MGLTITLGEVLLVLLTISAVVLVIYLVKLIRALIKTLAQVNVTLSEVDKAVQDADSVITDAKIVSEVAAEKTLQVAATVDDIAETTTTVKDIVMGNQSTLRAATNLVNAAVALKGMAKLVPEKDEEIRAEAPKKKVKRKGIMKRKK